MKVINIVLEETKGNMRILLFNETDNSGLTTKTEQEWADAIEKAMKDMSKVLHLLEDNFKEGE